MRVSICTVIKTIVENSQKPTIIIIKFISRSFIPFLLIKIAICIFFVPNKVYQTLQETNWTVLNMFLSCPLFFTYRASTNLLSLCGPVFCPHGLLQQTSVNTHANLILGKLVFCSKVETFKSKLLYSSHILRIRKINKYLILLKKQ